MNGHGGKRQGAGRKPEGEKAKVTTAGRISTEAMEQYDILCGVYGLSRGQMLEFMIRMEYGRLHTAD